MSRIGWGRRAAAFVGAGAVTLAGIGVQLGGGDPARAALGGLTQFEIDGNTAVGSGQDWLSDTSLAANKNLQDLSIVSEACNGDSPAQVENDRVVAGSKINLISIDNPPINSPGPLNVPKKTDLCRVYHAWELVKVNTTNGGGQYHFIFYGGWSRPNVNGEIDILFPLLGGDTSTTNDDVLLDYDFTDSSDGTKFSILKKTGASWLPITLSPANWEANTTRGVETLTGAGGQALTFGEFAIDLTAAGILPEFGPCVTLTAGDVMSRTGNSDNATLDDIVDAPPVTLTNCTKVTVTKETKPATPATPTDFDYTVDQLDGAIVAQPNDETSRGGTLTVPADPTDTQVDLLISPDYVVTEGMLPSDWTETSLVCSSFDPLTGQPVTATLFGGNPNDSAFPLAPNHDASCVIKNTGPPTLELYKKSVGGTGTFTLDYNVDAGSTSVLSGSLGGTTTSPGVPKLLGSVALVPGDLTVSEQVPLGWNDGGMVCTQNGNEVQQPITVVGGDEIICTQTNIKPGSVTVTKTVTSSTPGDWSVDFTITPNPATGIGSDTQTATAADPVVAWENLAGSTAYTITESNDGGLVPLPSATNPACTTDGTPAGTPGTVAPLTISFTTDSDGANNYECTFNNAEKGKITLTKKVNPSTATGWSFPFTLKDSNGTTVPPTTGGPATSSSPTIEWTGLMPDVEYTIEETNDASGNYKLGDITCTGATTYEGGSTTAAAPFDVVVSAGDEVVCTANNQQLGKVTITKTMTPTADTGWSFDFTLNPGGITKTASGSPSGANVVTFDHLDPAVTYTITESTETGYIDGPFICSKGIEDATIPTVTFTPAPGEAITCTADNQKKAALSVTKVVNPSSASGWSFPFTLTADDVTEAAPVETSGQTNATPADATLDWKDLLPGHTYTLTETNATGFVMGDITCTGVGGPSGAPVSGPSPLKIKVSAGDTVACTATNDKKASLTLTKVVSPQTATGWSFGFTLNPGDPADQVPTEKDGKTAATAAAPTMTWEDLLPGHTYIVGETNDASGNYKLGSITCTGVTGATGGTVTGAQPLNIKVSAGDSVSCTARNEQLASVTVTKTVVPASATGWSFTFKISPPPGGQEPATKTATPASPSATWNFLDPAVEYTISEINVDGGYTAKTLTCSYGETLAGAPTFTPAPGEAVTCSATNEKKGMITLTKVVNPLSATGWSFGFTLKNSASATVAERDGQTAATKADPELVWQNLLPGDYTLTEQSVPGYLNGDITCSGVTFDEFGTVTLSSGDTLHVSAGDDITCTANNTKLARVRVTKKVRPALTGWSFDFTISPKVGTQPTTRTATSAAPTVEWIDLLPFTSYTITETARPDFVEGQLVCTGDLAEPDAAAAAPATGAATFVPKPGGLVNCEITNSKTDVQVRKRAVTDEVAKGEDLDWKITVKNNGPVVAEDVALVDAIPTVLTLGSVSGPAGWDCSGSTLGNPGTVRCTKPSMAVGETATFVVRTKVTGDVKAGDVINNQAVVRTTTGETRTDNNKDKDKVKVVEELPVTGAGSTWWLTLIALGFVTVGFGALQPQRRRRRRLLVAR